MHVMERVALALLWLLSQTLLLVMAAWRWLGLSAPRVPLPPLDTSPSSPLLLPATELAGRIRRREVRCVAVLNACIDRIRAINPVVNAVVADRFVEALAEAARLDERLASTTGDEEKLEKETPLLGVPFTAKEAFAIQGLPNSSGLLSRNGVRSQQDAAAVAALRRAGAIPLGVTNCSELCMWYESSNLVYGLTRNPYDTRRIVGGSSGGEGAVLAAAGCAVGIGSDIGGSIRMPAFFNGIFGHKPTAGVVPNGGQFPNASGSQGELLVTGPMCRYAQDLLPVLRIMAGPKASLLKLEEEVDLRRLRFFSMEHDGGSPYVERVHAELIAAQRRVVVHLQERLGVQVQSLALDKFKFSFQIWSATMSLSGKDGKPAQSFAELMGDRGPAVSPRWELLKWPLGLSRHTLPAIGLGLMESLANLNPKAAAGFVRLGGELRAELSALLGDDGVLLYPSHPRPAPFHNEPILTPFNFAYTGIFNVLGLPVTQCPLGLGQDRVPLGIQVVGNHRQDRLTLAVARELERGFGGWVNPDRDPGAN
ncbi:unnamed protein product [Lampetra fluviatilis]